ncbi:PREDICTED: synaptotagmin-17, partial [Ficedula albicollis]|uniref:synaptotagmin-17 n=1 Tax=Ficedula albicollis TaxID=59894 RepID=UPI0007AD8598
RRCSADAPRSARSIARRVSGLESRRPSSPLIDIKPIEFGIIGAKKEIVQPTVLRKTYTPDDYFRKFEPRLYSLDSNSDDMDSLTDEEILSKYQLGMLHFSTQYDLLHNYLIVRVIEAKDLPPPISYDGSRQDMAHSNPYVKICLLPDQKNSKQTGVKRKTQNPVFEERYTFEIPFLEAQRRTLLLTVVDFDKFSRHCVIGKVSMPLSDVDLVKGGHWWKALVPSSQNEVELGELLLSLNYLPSAGRLNVDIIRAKQLLQTDMSQGSDPFVKIQLVHGLKLTKTKKTSCMRGTIDPFYNESFSFKVPQEELENASLVFTVYGHNVKSSNDFVGRIVLGQFPTGAPESSHWRRIVLSALCEQRTGPRPGPARSGRDALSGAGGGLRGASARGRGQRGPDIRPYIRPYIRPQPAGPGPSDPRRRRDPHTGRTDPGPGGTPEPCGTPNPAGPPNPAQPEPRTLRAPDTPNPG